MYMYLICKQGQIFQEEPVQFSSCKNVDLTGFFFLHHVALFLPTDPCTMYVELFAMIHVHVYIEYTSSTF